MDDPRDGRGLRRGIGTVPATALCALLCGSRSLRAIGRWAADTPRHTRTRLGRRIAGPEPAVRIAPGTSTIRRVRQSPHGPRATGRPTSPRRAARPRCRSPRRDARPPPMRSGGSPTRTSSARSISSGSPDRREPARSPTLHHPWAAAGPAAVCGVRSAASRLARGASCAPLPQPLG
ncbi:transposase family protein [Streptomonospora salina]|uniref:transposase family protein n=1 Tax=Streptomonospora salina TaxID=104205 RepID=UPI00161B2E6B